MIDYTTLYTQLAKTGLASWQLPLSEKLDAFFSENRHGDFPKWQDVLKKLPEIIPGSIDLTASAVRAGIPGDCDNDLQIYMKNQLKTFIPWRKGPFLIHDIYINAEWRSDWKWDRLQPYIEPLKDRCVLDVGCGSGYHCWRMAGEGAKLVIGIDPYLLYLAQFQAIKHFLKQDNVFVLPFSLETLPEGKLNFDTVFSMGVLYHRRSPLDHLLALRSCLRSGGQLVLETLVTEGENGYTLLPEGRYAGMRNTWFIPSPLTLESWLRKCGFQQIRFLEKTPTTTNEQRSTEWMPYLSLKDHLHKTNPQLTNEGHPAPVRAIFLANAP